MSRYTHTARRLRCQHGDQEPILMDEDDQLVSCYECGILILVESDGVLGDDDHWRCEHCHDEREAAQ